jgi:hypothetical protein
MKIFRLIKRGRLHSPEIVSRRLDRITAWQLKLYSLSAKGNLIEEGRLLLGGDEGRFPFSPSHRGLSGMR